MEQRIINLSDKSKLPLTLAVALIISSGIIVTVMQAGVRFLSIDVHPFTIVFFRAFFGVLLLLPLMLKWGPEVFKTTSPKLQVLRGIIGSGGMLCFFYGLSIVTLAEAVTLGFTVPIFATLLAIVFFKERVGKWRWFAIFMGLVGVFIIIRPDIEIGLGPILILVASLSWSISVLIAKKLTEDDSNISIAFWQTLGNVPLALIMTIYVWVAPSQTQLMILLLIALLGTLAQTSLNAALRRGEVSFLLPFDYLRLLWSILIGYAVFKDFPSAGLFIGGILIVFATSLMAYREAKKSQE